MADPMQTPPQQAAPPTAQAGDLAGFNFNPITNPSHPSHAMVARHMGAALGHLLIGDGETAAHHIGQAIGHTLAPHMPGKDPAVVGKAVTDNIRAAAHGGGKSAKKPAKKPAERKARR